MQLPYQDPGATTANGRAVAAKAATLDGLGRLSCRFSPRPAGGGYLVHRMVVQGPAGSVAAVYVGDPDTLALADVTRNGSSDVADYANPPYVPPDTDLWVVWTDVNGGNYPTGTAASARIETEDLT